MKHADFKIGQEFYCSGVAWRCTDIGTRVIIAIKLDDNETVSAMLENGVLGPETHHIMSREQSEREGWFKGPPYAVAELVWDEYSMPACSLNRQGDDD